MTTRRMTYWWFRFVVSGRFLEKFLNLRTGTLVTPCAGFQLPRELAGLDRL